MYPQVFDFVSIPTYISNVLSHSATALTKTQCSISESFTYILHVSMTAKNKFVRLDVDAVDNDDVDNGDVDNDNDDNVN